MNIGEVLKTRRLELQLTLEEVARRTGVTAATVSRWESGEIGSMRLTIAAKLANALHISPLAFIKDCQWKQGNTKIPLIGKVVNGHNLFSKENIVGEVDVELEDSDGIFAFKANDESMAPRVEKNDIVIVDVNEPVLDDVAAVVQVGENLLIRLVQRTQEGIMLTSLNTLSYPSKFYGNSEIDTLPVVVLGKVKESRHFW